MGGGVSATSKVAIIGPTGNSGYPSGIISAMAKVEKDRNSFAYREVVIGRTAWRIMEGYVCVPERKI